MPDIHGTREELVAMIAEQRTEIERLRGWIRRIDNINDNPSHYSSGIDAACACAYRGEVNTGMVDYPPKSFQPKQ